LQVQGGFLLLRPSEATYEQMVEIVREGDFRPSKGWGGSGIGWCWGGQTIQGLVSYFVNLVEPSLVRSPRLRRHPAGTTATPPAPPPPRSATDAAQGVPLDACKYNSMASTKKCELEAKIDEVASIHYTVCQKPWECRRGANAICAEFLHAWWMVRDDLERAQGLKVYGRCCGVSPSAICPNRRYKPVEQNMLASLPMTPRPGQPAVVGPIVHVPKDLPHVSLRAAGRTSPARARSDSLGTQYGTD
jgi:hypothetical protein